MLTFNVPNSTKTKQPNAHLLFNHIRGQSFLNYPDIILSLFLIVPWIIFMCITTIVIMWSSVKEVCLFFYHASFFFCRYPTWTQSIIRFLARLTTQVSVRHDLSRRIAEINSRLEDIIINKEKYNVEIESNKSTVLWKTSTNISTITPICKYTWVYM
jgi:hypothetical protein